MDNTKNDITILVSSCDLYEDAWEPFFRLLKIQWPECPYKIVLNTEVKEYRCDFLNVRTFKGGKDTPWSKRLKNCLKTVDTDYVLFFLEDQFLREPVNTEWWDKTAEYIRNNPNVGVIFPRHTGKQTQNIDEDFFPRSKVTENMQIVGMAALYNKNYFIKLLRDHESAWEFEQYASIRCKKYPEEVLQYNARCPAIFVYDDKIEKGYGITQRKWLPGNKALFDKYGIKVNFDRLGFLDTTSFKNNGREAAPDKNTFIEHLYGAKKKITGIPAKIKKYIRKRKSLK
ncbi:MAG: hypothetical protein IJL87_06380 [Clostridia bacterium]|nr:hypothetical protein [Clostridia bacterium]